LSSQSSHGFVIPLDIYSGFVLELFNAVINNCIIKVFSSQMSVSAGGFDLEKSILYLKKRDVKSTTTEIENKNHFLSCCISVESVGNGCGGWLVNNS
jgi:hypothetical protein